MFRWVLVFLFAALAVAVLGFTGLAGAFSDIAKFLFFVFLFVGLTIFVLAILTKRARF